MKNSVNGLPSISTEIFSFPCCVIFTCAQRGRAHRGKARTAISTILFIIEKTIMDTAMKTVARWCGLFVAAGVAMCADSTEFFETKVRPVLAKNCYGCHTDSKMGGLRLDSADSVKQGGKSGPPIVAGKPEESLLIQAIRQTHERLKMPPSGKLKDQEIADIAEWIKAGAVWPAGTPASQPKPSGAEYVITAEQRAFWS